MLNYSVAELRYETKSSTIKNEHDKNAIISYALLLLQHYGFRAEHDPRN